MPHTDTNIPTWLKDAWYLNLVDIGTRGGITALARIAQIVDAHGFDPNATYLEQPADADTFGSVVWIPHLIIARRRYIHSQSQERVENVIFASRLHHLMDPFSNLILKALARSVRNPGLRISGYSKPNL